MAKKRKAGDGLIRQRTDGRWEGRYVVGYDDHGYPKTKAVFGKSKRECAEKLAALKAQLGGIPSDKLRPEMRFADWLDYWLSLIHISLLPIQFSIQQFYEQKLAKLDAECEQERIRKRLEAFQLAQQKNACPPA